jgi:hypothetical protein
MIRPRKEVANNIKKPALNDQSAKENARNMIQCSVLITQTLDN